MSTLCDPCSWCGTYYPLNKLTNGQCWKCKDIPKCAKCGMQMETLQNIHNKKYYCRDERPFGNNCWATGGGVAKSWE